MKTYIYLVFMMSLNLILIMRWQEFLADSLRLMYQKWPSISVLTKVYWPNIFMVSKNPVVNECRKSSKHFI